VLPARVTRRLAIEAGATGLWWRYVGAQGRVLGIDVFGESGKAADVFRKYKLDPDNIAKVVLEFSS
jgi:transketolase